ncbi:MAG: Gfo/Idh/MocA family oxidoreductase [Armatimonadetes bacterium]|nr:Gfo/Idh/MocA family oxidoreductase [Armatimonadota bacterium]
MKDGKVGIGVIGTGFGRVVQIPGFLASPHAKVVAVCSGRKEKAEQVAREFDIPYAFTDYRDLVKVEEVDLVSVTAPPYLHHPHGMAALQAGKHVLSEKPFCLTPALAQEMVDAARHAGIINVVDHEQRFTPACARIRELIQEGYIGRVRHIFIITATNMRADARKGRTWDWTCEAEKGGGSFGGTGSHWLDLMRYWLGEIVAVVGHYETHVKERIDPAGQMRPVTADDYTGLLLRFAGGATGALLLTAVAHHGRGTRFEIAGEEGSLVFDEEERLWGARGGEALTPMVEPDSLPMPPGMNYTGRWGRPFVRLAAHLVDVIRSGRKDVAPAATFYDGMRVRVVMDAVRRSPREGWVNVAPS